MAATSSKAAKASRPAAPKQVVPAIPLSFAQRRKKSQPVAAKPKEEVVDSPPPVDEPSLSSKTQSEVTTPAVNDSQEQHTSEISEETIESVSPSTPATPSAEDEAAEKDVVDVVPSEASASQGMQTRPLSIPPMLITNFWQKNHRTPQDRLLLRLYLRYRDRPTRCPLPLSRIQTILLR